MGTGRHAHRGPAARRGTRRRHVPLPETVTDETAAGRVYRVRWRGDDVIGIEPEGRIRPMYPTRTPAPRAPLREHTLHVPAVEWSW